MVKQAGEMLPAEDREMDFTVRSTAPAGFQHLLALVETSTQNRRSRRSCKRTL
jgi:hypothetical protein